MKIVPALPGIRLRVLGAGSLLALAACAIAPARAQTTTYYPKQATESQRGELTNRSAGFVRSQVAGEVRAGTATVARHPRLLYTAAHVLWASGKWAPASKIEFHRLLHQELTPDPGDVHPRGILYNSSYRSNAWDLDFAILYGNGNFGPASPYFPTNGVAMLRSGRLKKTVGYPDPIKAWDEGDSRREGFYYQHNTGPFSNPGTPYGSHSRFLRINDVSTGTGNSGGPAYVRNSNGSYGLAGVLVAGFGRTQVGVHGMDWTSYAMGSDALGRIGINARVSKRVRAKKRFRIPSGKKKYRPRKAKARVRGLVGHVRDLKFRAKFINRGRKPLQAYLKAPSGRTHFVVRGKKGKRRKVKINKNYSNKFRGARANGVWKLYMRDKKRGDRNDRVIFRNFLLRISD